MGDSDSVRGVKQRLLDLIDESSISDRRLSLLATGNSSTVRALRRGANPRLDTLEALCRVLGLRLEMVSLNKPCQPSERTPGVEKQPEWSRRLREGIRQDLVEILGRGNKLGLGRTGRSRITDG